MRLSNKNKISDFKKIINFELSKRGDFDNLKYQPTFKSSAIFYFIFNNSINTKISFLNYWKLKNLNNDVSCLYTVRDINGKKIYRDFFKLKNNTYTFSLKKILKEKLDINELTGSINIELFSSDDLKFAYPAIDAIYETEHGVSLVHSNQRVLDEIKDNLENQSLNQTQTGFDIYCDNEKNSFFVAINGSLEIKNKQLKINFINSKGKQLQKNFKFKLIKAYSVIQINLNEIKGLKYFFNKEKGFCKINLPTENIFNRVLIGTLSKDKKKITTTHSYYDCSKINDYVNITKLNPNEYSCYIPFNLIENIDLEIVIYPIFSKCNLIFDLEMYNKLGFKKVIKENLLELRKNFKQSVSIKINKYLKNIKNVTDNVYCLKVNSQDGKIPTRMTYGFNYKQVSFGSNISDAMVVNHGIKSRSNTSKGFYWGPVFNSKNISTTIALSFINNTSKDEKQSVNLKIYDQKNIIYQKKFRIKSPEAINLDIKKLINKKNKITKDNILWFSLESSGPKNFVCKHVHKSIYGHISADHSF